MVVIGLREGPRKDWDGTSAGADACSEWSVVVVVNKDPAAAIVVVAPGELGGWTVVGGGRVGGGELVGGVEVLGDGFVVGAGEAVVLAFALMLAEGRGSGAEVVVVGVAGLGPTAAEAAGTGTAAAVVAGLAVADPRFRSSLSR